MALKILVTGGAGYIGSHVCKLLAKQGYLPIVVDNLAYGHEWAVKWGPLYKMDLAEKQEIKNLIKSESPAAVIHFAAYAYVGESVQNPAKYYHNNVVGTLALLEAMKEVGLSKIVFSSTCATYGNPTRIPMDELHPQDPINPYGQTKLIVEKILKDFGSAYAMQSVSLRYFNASGADPDGEIGESHNPETHLIPLAIRAAFDHSRPLTIMGTDYPTPDGTCIRDYIHVNDLASAHIAALEYMFKSQERTAAFNLGTGKGVSVFEIVKAVEKITGKKVHQVLGERRPGDPPALVADGARACQVLRWSPQHSELSNIVRTAVKWYERGIH